MPDDRDVLPYVYRVTMYDPTDRDEYGHYTGPKDTVSDHGRSRTPICGQSRRSPRTPGSTA